MSFQSYSLGAQEADPPSQTQDLLTEGKAQAAWTNAAHALNMAIPRVTVFNAIAKQLGSQGRWSGRLDDALSAWTSDVQKLLQQMVAAIQASPSAQSALDMQIAAVTGAATTTPGAWREFVSELVPPPTVSGLGFWQAAFGGMARVFSNPAVWNGAKEVLLKLAPWVSSYLVTENIAASLNTNAKFVEEKGKNLGECMEKLAAADLTDAQRAGIERLCIGAQDPGSSTGLWLVAAAAGAAGLLYWQTRSRIKVQSPVRLAGLSKAPRRRS